MLILKAFKFELMPNGAQVCKMKQFCGCSRFVFNRALDYQNKQYEADKSFKFSYHKIVNLLPETKKIRAGRAHSVCEVSRKVRQSAAENH